MNQSTRNIIQKVKYAVYNLDKSIPKYETVKAEIRKDIEAWLITNNDITITEMDLYLIGIYLAL